MVDSIEEQNRRSARELKRLRLEQKRQHEQALEEERQKERRVRAQEQQDLASLDKRKQGKPLTQTDPGQGIPMKGVSQSAGLTGGTKAPEQKGPITETAKADKGAKRAAQAAGLTSRIEPPKDEKQKKQEEELKEIKRKEKEIKRQQEEDLKRSEARKRGITERKELAAKRGREEEELGEGARGRGWRRALRIAKYKAQEKKLARKKKITEMVTAPAQQGTGHLLKLAWLNLIDTFGLTWFYIAFHFIAAYFTPFSNLFCKFGEEWIPKQAQKGPAGEAAKRASKPLELIESCGCILIGLILLLLILGIVMLIALIAYAHEHTLDFLMKIPGIAWGLIKHYVGGVGGKG